MKKCIFSLFAVFCMFNLAFATEQSDITGQWNGILSVQGTNMRLVFHIEKTEEGYVSSMDSPDQGAFGISVATTSFDDSTLILEIPSIGLFFEGELDETSIIGTFKQGGLELPLTLEKTMSGETRLNRPQEPIPPFPYRSE